MPINTMEAVGTTVDTKIVVAEKDAVHNAEEIGEVEEIFVATVI